MGALAMREVEKRLTEDRRALVRGGLTPGRFLRKRTQHGKLLGKKCRKKVGKHARKSKQNRKCPQRGETSSSGETSSEDSRSEYSSSEEEFYLLCDAVKRDVEETGDTSFFPEEAVDKFVKHVEANQDDSKDEEKPEAIPHGPMHKPKKKRHEDECRTLTLQNDPTINRTEGNKTSTRVTGKEEEIYVSTKLALEAMHDRGFCKDVSYDRLVKLLQKHYTWTWKGKVVFDTWTWEGTVVFERLT